MPLEILMERYVDGDVAAYEQLYQLIKPPITASLVKWLKQRHHVDDAFQITLMKIHANRGRYRKNAPVIPWVLTIGRNVALDMLRSSAHKTQLLEPEGVARIKDEKLSSQNWTASEEAEIISAVRDAINELPESYREVVRQHKLEERTMGEIAQTLGIKEGSVRVRAHRGYKALAKLLKKRWGGDE